MPKTMIRLGEVLVEYGYITEAQVEQALAYQKQHKDKRLGEALIEMGYITEAQMLSALAQKLSMRFIPLDTYPIQADCVAKIPKALAQRYNLIAVGTRGNHLVVAMNDPLNFYALEDIKLVTGMLVQVVLASKEAIQRAIEYQYAEVDARSAAAASNIDADSFQSMADQIDLNEDDQTPVVKLLNSLLVRGYTTGVSDIHIEPYETELLVRMRIDGQLIDYVTLQPQLHLPLIARTKILCGMDIAEKRLPQDGHFKNTIEGFEMNVRANVIPTIYGEKAVLRFLNTTATIERADTFGMDEENYQKCLEILQNPHGVIYITGPTGSGKTTTLYLMLERLTKQPINVATIEDPVEKNLPRINQMQVNPQAGLTFEIGLRALLRQDPDVIMVGETRDSQTAQISVRSAITGHLVLSTLHTNDAVSAIVRMEDMGVEPFMVANSLVGVVAQRLAKKLCPSCRYADTPTPEEQDMLGPDVTQVYRSKGCHMCNSTGYKGRVAVHEVITIDKNMRRMISAEQDIDDIYQYVRDNQHATTLRGGLIRLVRNGVTDPSEVVRLTYGAD
ncbi:GspE/PulE family protein [uncultured Allofournierella sp.]|uniref:GspE/PulE family protein n=1 Tax=uncultured Allofournierella sp. TaxID=1940258 RepID=UPI0037500568